jgi:signal peptidase II
MTQDGVTREGITRDPRLELVPPLVLSTLIIVADQITKALVAARIPEGRIGWSALGDFFWLVHARNLGIAFSIGQDLGGGVRKLLFIILPTLLIAGSLYYYFKASDTTRFQRWALAVLVGGGFGNLIDRIFRPEGVVDFLSFKFYGLLGMDRFPTFNIADMSIVCGAFALALTGFLMEARNTPQGKDEDR